MKGLWKENIGGWNHKDSKRKSQRRKNSIKDNGRQIIRIFDGYRRVQKTNPSIFRYENEETLTYTSKSIITGLMRVFVNEFNRSNKHIFMYNKPVSWRADLHKLYNDGRRRKIGQNMVNSSDRNYLHLWIVNGMKTGNWDNEIKTHAYSKSINWWVH
jgi:hypothetical protein